MMRKLTIAALGASVMLTGCIGDSGPRGYSGSHRDYRSYDYNRPDPQYGGYDASHYYQAGWPPP